MTIKDCESWEVTFSPRRCGSSCGWALRCSPGPGRSCCSPAWWHLGRPWDGRRSRSHPGGGCRRRSAAGERTRELLQLTCLIWLIQGDNRRFLVFVVIFNVNDEFNVNALHLKQQSPFFFFFKCTIWVFHLMGAGMLNTWVLMVEWWNQCWISTSL